MLSLVLIKAGWDPTVIVGTKLKEFGGRNFRLGKSDFLVLEADEWKGAFWNYSPSARLSRISTASIWISIKISGTSKKFFEIHLEHPDRRDSRREPRRRKTFLAEARDRKTHETEWCETRLVFGCVRFSVHRFPSEKNLSVPGKHNLQNAMAVYVLARNLGIPEKRFSPRSNNIAAPGVGWNIGEITNYKLQITNAGLTTMPTIRRR